jgi:hypothetical protein
MSRELRKKLSHQRKKKKNLPEFVLSVEFDLPDPVVIPEAELERLLVVV